MRSIKEILIHKSKNGFRRIYTVSFRLQKLPRNEKQSTTQQSPKLRQFLCIASMGASNPHMKSTPIYKPNHHLNLRRSISAPVLLRLQFLIIDQTFSKDKVKRKSLLIIGLINDFKILS